MTMWQLFETEMLKHKYIHSILQRNKFNTINIKFKFRILEAPLMDENKDTKMSGNYRKFSTLAPKI